MVRMTLHMKVKSGLGPEFEHAWLRVAEQVSRVPGNLRQALSRDREEKNQYIITSDWQTEESFREFERSTRQDELTRGLREMRESGRMIVEDLLVQVEGVGRSAGS
jgi:heme-degrading monooxygenase HmoA